MTTRLITDPNDPARYTSRRETDARTALTRGLSEYLLGTSGTQGGRSVTVEATFDTWAEAETSQKVPLLVVLSTDIPGNYGARTLTPQVADENKVAVGDKVAQNVYLVSPADFEIMLQVELWCSDPVSRKILMAALEDAFTPTDWMYGVRLELGHYFNERAEYSLVSSAYMDSEADATKRYRKAQLQVSARVPQSRLLQRAAARVIYPRVTALDGDGQ